MIVLILLSFKGPYSFNQGIVLAYQLLVVLLESNRPSLVILCFLSRTVNIVAYILQSFLYCVPFLLLFAKLLLEFVDNIFVFGIVLLQHFIGVLQFLDRFEHFLAFLVVISNYIILFFNCGREGNNKAILISALIQLIVCLGMDIAGVISLLILSDIMEGKLLPCLLYVSLLNFDGIQLCPQGFVVSLNFGQLLMQQADFNTFCIVLFLQALRIFIQQAYSSLLFVKIHVKKYYYIRPIIYTQISKARSPQVTSEISLIYLLGKINQKFKVLWTHQRRIQQKNYLQCV